ncbi:hypothetical protein SY83_19830 [Paenibacillus swuensis]|uniref:N-acetyltransferase domain-containing protein n=1 Tax=Paenibacillus swuensis TaxID=1178515 RepID=A0A172TMB3_9BACL|nr:GNAT family protein [Paenibacillus swuensis]ANE48168.1 hypothetical protein SY83_19830 [Paenibacillus swuensis]
MFKHIIEPGLHLQILEKRHAQEVLNMIEKNRSYLAEWLPWAETTTKVEHMEGFIETELHRFAKNNGFTSGIFIENQFCGCIGIHPINWNDRHVSIGYWLGEDFQGKGIMTKANKAIHNYIFDELDLNKIHIQACAGNVKSQTIPQRLGFTQEGILRQYQLLNGVYHDHFVYGLLKEERTNLGLEES